MIRKVGAQEHTTPPADVGEGAPVAQVHDRPILTRIVQRSPEQTGRPLDGGRAVFLAGAEHDRHVDLITGSRVESGDEHGREAGCEPRAEYDAGVRIDSDAGRFTLVFMAPPDQKDCPVELTYNWDGDEGLPSDSRHFGHLAYSVPNIYEMCQHLMDNGVTINRPPRDGRMAFVRSPDNVSIELLQQGDALEPAEPWASMGNTGHW